MLYQNIKQLNLSNETVKFIFNIKGITYISNDKEVWGDGYIPISDDELTQLLDDYTQWCAEFEQEPNEQLKSDLVLAKFKEQKQGQVRDKSNQFRETLINKDMFITSSLGFKVDADKDSQDNIQGLIDIVAVSQQQVPYRDRENQTHMLNLEQLQTLALEMKTNGANLFTQKWQIEDRISKAQTLDALNKIKIEFTMQDFSKKE